MTISFDSVVSERRNGIESCCIQLILLLVAYMVWTISAVFGLALVGFGCFGTFWLVESVLDPVTPVPNIASGYHTDQMSEGGQVSNVTLSV